MHAGLVFTYLENRNKRPATQQIQQAHNSISNNAMYAYICKC